MTLTESILALRLPRASTLALLAMIVITAAYGIWTADEVFWGGLVAIGVLYGAIYVVGVRAGRGGRERSFSEMALAGRKLPLGVGVLTMTATWVGGGYVNGTAEATYASGLLYVQAPWGYALSLILGGVFFAPVMRRHGFTTMLDPFERRYGARMASLLYLPALTGELFWTAAILTALGGTFDAVLGLGFVPSIMLSAAIAVAYTARSGLWAVAFTDVVQLVLLFVGLWLVVPVAAREVGGLGRAWQVYTESTRAATPAHADWWMWWDSALLLILGGIPWHVYFQRVLATPNERAARHLSVLAGVLCLVAAVAPVLIGMIGRAVEWSAYGVDSPEAAMVLPYVLRYLTSPLVGTLGLAGLAAAVMSSVDSSTLSAASMAAWNVYRPAVRPDAGSEELSRVVRRVVVMVGVTATLLALQVRSVYALWFLCSDFVYCILFPQLVTVLYDRRANVYGSAAGFVVSLGLRLSAGEALVGLPGFISYTVGPAGDVVTLPFRTIAMLGGLSTIVIVSRIMRSCRAPQPLGD